MFTESINLARRLSRKNEPDLVQETFCDEDNHVSRSYCEKYAISANKLSELPNDCKQYADIIEAIRDRHFTELNGSTFSGMHTGQALGAMAARKRGQLSHAQIQRRMTNTKDKSFW